MAFQRLASREPRAGSPCPSAHARREVDGKAGTTPPHPARAVPALTQPPLAIKTCGTSCPTGAESAGTGGEAQKMGGLWDAQSHPGYARECSIPGLLEKGCRWCRNSWTWRFLSSSSFYPQQEVAGSGKPSPFQPGSQELGPQDGSHYRQLTRAALSPGLEGGWEIIPDRCEPMSSPGQSCSSRTRELRPSPGSTHGCYRCPVRAAPSPPFALHLYRRLLSVGREPEPGGTLCCDKPVSLPACQLTCHLPCHPPEAMGPPRQRANLPPPRALAPPSVQHPTGCTG